MKKNVLFVLLTILCSICIGFSTKELVEVIKHNYETSKLISENYSKNVYYNLHPVVNNDPSLFDFATYDDQIDYGYSDKYDNEIRNFENVKNVYEYMGLALGNYYDINGEVHDISLVNNDQNKTLDIKSIDQIFLILPYYEDDKLDQDMNMVFISKELSQLLLDNGLTNRGNYEINHVRIPVGKTKTEMTYVGENNGNVNYDANEIQFEYKSIQVSFNATLDNDYYEPIYQTRYVIFVPYTQFKEILGDFEPATRKVYIDSDLSTKENEDLLNNIQSIGKDIKLYQYQSWLNSGNDIYNSLKKNTVYLSVFLLFIATMMYQFVVNKYVKKNERVMMNVVLFIGANVVAYLMAKKIQIYVILGCTIVILLLSIINFIFRMKDHQIG